MKKQLLVLISGFLLFITYPVYAELDLVIDKSGDGDSIALFIAPFSGESHAQRMRTILTADLKRSGRFNFISDKTVKETGAFGGSVNTSLFKKAGAEFLIRGRTVPKGKDFSLEVEIIDLNNGKKVAGYISSHHKNIRRIAHKTSDAVFKHFTGIRGAFDTRIAYVAANGSGDDRIYQLIVSDADGYTPHSVVTSLDPIMSIDWSPNGKELAYVSFESGYPAIFIQNLKTGERRKVSSRKGINGAPAWSSNGKMLAVSLSLEGNPEIYTLNVQTGALKRLTNSRAIDTEPSWTADGKEIIFTSDRGGTPQLYRMSTTENAKPVRMTFTGGYNSDPSVVGQKIALIRRMGGNFRVAVMDMTSHEADIVSTGRLDESPSLAPNGTMVLFEAKGTGRQHILSVVSDNGRARTMLHTPYADVGHPAWSPYLQ